MKQFFKDGQTVLFQGDSITEWGRDFNDPKSLGNGYANIVVERFNEMFPNNKVKFVNRGVSGDRIFNLIERYVEDILDINPDVISILVGINDVWRRYDSNDPSTVEAFYDHYEYLLKMIKKHLSDTKIIIMEPFLLHSSPELEKWHEDLDPKIQAVRKVASQYADYYIPLDGIFAKLCVEKYNPDQLAQDGVHPTDLGFKAISDEYFKLFLE